ncbi:MAG: ABC transporter permease [Candidatus Dojkabacteria bacterium]|nr:ABC transporter permease [Candidatus Dojkabacteria bacterium]
MKNLKLLGQLTIANIKMFIRDKSALFWSLAFPFVIIGIFGLLDFASLGNSTIGLVYDDNTSLFAQQVQQVFEENDAYKFSTGSLDDELSALENDERVSVLEFTEDAETNTVVVNSYISKENQQVGEIFTLITEKILADISLQMKHITLPFNVNTEIVNTNNLRYIDFVVPGVIGLSLMQGALFGAIGTIVVNREKGVLRRIFATPLPKGIYLISAIISRTVISIAQVAILILVSYFVFGITIVGNLLLVAGISILGSLTFLAMGILFSGFSKTQESAQAIVMPFQMVFMFTSGVYFDRSVLPDWLFRISEYFPLTYLSEALRNVMVRGAGVESQAIQYASLGLLIWLIVLVIIGIKSFRWEIEK